MRSHMIQVGALATSSMILWWASGRGAEVRAVEPAELRAPLFDHETARQTGARMHRTSASIDVARMVHKWERSGRGPVADDRAKRVMRGLVVLTAVAFQANVQSAIGQESGTNVCSTSDTPDGNGPNGCSLNTSGISPAACSTQSPGYGDTNCSTQSTTSSSSICSADVSSTGPNGGDNLSCSVDSPTASGQYCSSFSGGGKTVTACSTGGGQSIPGSSNGAVACSAAGGTPKTNTCSTNGLSAGQSCSTYTGQHQSCSSGNTDAAGDSAFCSANSTVGNDAPNAGMCSVSQDAPPADGGTVYGNQCSAIATGDPPDNGTANCSTNLTGTGTCSVMDAANTANAQCTTFGTPGAGATYQCSAFGEGINDTCSWLDAQGKFVKGQVNGRCGNAYKGHEN